MEAFEKLFARYLVSALLVSHTARVRPSSASSPLRRSRPYEL